MTSQNIYERLRKLLSEQLNVPSESISPKSLIAEDLGADSLDIAEIAMLIKDEFDYDINDEELPKIKSVENIVKLISDSTTKTT